LTNSSLFPQSFVKDDPSRCRQMRRVNRKVKPAAGVEGFQISQKNDELKQVSSRSGMMIIDGNTGKLQGSLSQIPGASFIIPAELKVTRGANGEEAFQVRAITNSAGQADSKILKQYNDQDALTKMDVHEQHHPKTQFYGKLEHNLNNGNKNERLERERYEQLAEQHTLGFRRGTEMKSDPNIYGQQTFKQESYPVLENLTMTSQGRSHFQGSTKTSYILDEQRRIFAEIQAQQEQERASREVALSLVNGDVIFDINSRYSSQK